MKLSAKYRQRLAEYIWFARQARKPSGSGFILLNKKLPIFNIKDPGSFPSSQDGLSPNHAMQAYESTGKLRKCRNGSTLAWLICGKGLRDWSISEWANGWADGLIGGVTELRSWGIPESLIASVDKAWRAIVFGRCQLREVS